ncbi:MAG TPA: ribosome-binding factor A [Acidimicrobiales bacterium]
MTRRRRSHATAREYPRTARLNHLLQEIIAEEIERIEDDRLGFFTVVAVDVDADLQRATVWYSAVLADGVPVPDDDDDLLAALEDLRRPLQAAVGRQARIRRTPELVFRPDEVGRQADRVEAILRDLAPAPAPGPAAPPAPVSTPGSTPPPGAGVTRPDD